jgi:hypothetical protein
MSPTKKTMVPKDTLNEKLSRQADEADRVLREARRLLKELAEEKQVRLIRDDAKADPV